MGNRRNEKTAGEANANPCLHLLNLFSPVLSLPARTISGLGWPGWGGLSGQREARGAGSNKI